MLNNIRYDLSDWLIHFFRDVDLDSGSGIVMPEHIGWNNLFEYDGKPLPAFFLLRCAIRQQMIWATWSYRNDRRTIYGKVPAVCFTDMPVAAFFEASEARKARGQHISPYAIIINKAQLAQQGALPAIYGLSQQYIMMPSASTEERVIDPKYIPLAEQYRYVSFNPSSKYPIDWTHEREWRWPYTGSFDAYNKKMQNIGLIDSFESMPSLNLLNPMLSGMGIAVNTSREAMLLSYDLLSLIDRGIISQSKYPFILSLDRITSPISLRDPHELNQAISQALINPLDGLSVDRQTVNSYDKLLRRLARQIASNVTPKYGQRGEAWLWLYDGRHPFARSLKLCDRLIINNDGLYLVPIYEFDGMYGLEQCEEMIRSLATALKVQIGIDCGYFSVRGHGNPNGVPFYCDPPVDNDFIYNKAW